MDTSARFRVMEELPRKPDATKTAEAVRARDQAREFLLAARRCNEFRPPPSGHQQFLFVPSLICYAFSVELGLKALALFEGKAPRWGHDLKDLLSDLSPGVQARIVAETRTQGERPTFFDQQLEIVRDVFDVWRYIYEKGHTVDTDLGFLQRLAAALEKVLREFPA